MLSTPTMKETDPQGPVAIDPEVVLAARADRAAPLGVPDAASRRSAAERQAYRAADAPALAVDPAFRATDVNAARDPGERSSAATWAVRTVVAVLFAVCSAVAAAAWQSYGDQAQELVARWMPRISLTSTSADKPESITPPTTTQTAAEEQAQPSAPAAVADNTVPAAAAGATQDSAQLLQSMARDLAAMGQQVGELKASLAQLKAGQEQMAHDMGRIAEAKAPERTSEARPFDPKAIEQTLRPRPTQVRPAAGPTVAAAAPVHRPRPASSYPPPQTVAAPPSAAAPMPLQSAPAGSGGEPVVRPPMPVR
jgi:hypothetical protein